MTKPLWQAVNTGLPLANLADALSMVLHVPMIVAGDYIVIGQLADPWSNDCGDPNAEVS